jgi:hypothetical protein
MKIGADGENAVSDNTKESDSTAWRGGAWRVLACAQDIAITLRCQIGRHRFG